MKTPADLDRIAKERSYRVQDTGLLLREDPIDGLGPAPEVSNQAFQLGDNAVTPALRVSRGWVYVTVTEKQAPYVPQLPEVQDKVRNDLVRERAAEIAKAKAGEIAATLKSAPDFAGAAKKAGLELKTKDGRWIPVISRPGELVINIGDMLQRLTNKYLRSTTHRVVNPPRDRASKARYSLPFFLHFNPDYEIRTLPGCITPERPNRYPEALNAQDFLEIRLKEIGLRM